MLECIGHVDKFITLQDVLMQKKYDCVIVGAGIMGCMLARILSQYNLSVLVIEKARDIADGSSKANSGVLYAGFHPKAKSLKGISCVQGNGVYDKICFELDVHMQRIGSLLVAFGMDGEEKLYQKYGKGLANGVEGMRIITGDEARQMEPGLSERVTKALWAPSTAIISPFELVWALAISAKKNGVEFQFNTCLKSLDTTDDSICIHTNTGDIYCDYLANVSGESADKIEQMVRGESYEITPRRGQYFVFDKQTPKQSLNHVIYQVQEMGEGGTLITPTTDGNICVGPTSQNVDSYSDKQTDQWGLAHVSRVARKVLPDIDMSKVITSFAGIRTNVVNIEKSKKDFYIRWSSDRVISALGIKNPGMTSAPYLCEMMSSMILEAMGDKGFTAERKSDWDPYVKLIRPYLTLDEQEQKALYSQDPTCAKVVCRCEGVCEGDIRRVMRSEIPPSNVAGLKLRLRCGMGRCQGSFCTSKILEIMAQEMGCEVEDICKYEEGSNYVLGKVK